MMWCWWRRSRPESRHPEVPAPSAGLEGCGGRTGRSSFEGFAARSHLKMNGSEACRAATSRPGARGLGLVLVALDLALLLVREPDVVESVEQAVLAVGVDLELDHAAIGAADLLLLEIDGQRGVGAAV